MTFKEAVENVILNNFTDGNFIESDQSEALTNHTAFFDGILDNEKEKIAQILFDVIVDYNEKRWKCWTTTQPTAKPTRVINNELKTVNAFLELLDKHGFDNINTEPLKKTKNGGFRIDMRPNLEYRNAQSVANKMKHDLEKLKKKCNQSELLILKKPRYYKNTKTKKDIENTIKTIMSKNSIAIDYLSILDVRAFIARL